MPGSSRLRRRVRLGCGVLLTAAALAACGGANETSLVRSKVMQFATATSRHDYRTICRQVLGPQLLSDIAAGGLSCEKAMSLALDRVKGAQLKVGTIRVSGNHASVQTLTQASGEAAAFAILELEHTTAGWRIKSLGNAAAPG